jgi:hypothetical protein
MKGKTVRKFTCDSLIRTVTQKRKTAAKDSAAAKDSKPEPVPVDLNEIHRRFWAKLAGK